jgi:peptidoglycan/xylan/chitin deacetylase (PgdA/CDA1 family)
MEKELRRSQSGLLVTRSSFERQLRFLKNNYSVISIDSLCANSKIKAKPARPLAITFDDGYLDNYTQAYPLLKEFGVPATIFIATNFMDSKNCPLWEKNWFDERSMMSWTEVREMASQNISFGAHTKAHIVYGSQPSEDVCYDEIGESKKILEEKLDVEITSFAFPEGRYNLSALNAAKMSGYKKVFSLVNRNRKDIVGQIHKSFIVERIPVNEGMYTDSRGIFHIPIFACAVLGLFKT